MITYLIRHTNGVWNEAYIVYAANVVDAVTAAEGDRKAQLFGTMTVEVLTNGWTIDARESDD